MGTPAAAVRNTQVENKRLQRAKRVKAAQLPSGFARVPSPGIASKGSLTERLARSKKNVSKESSDEFLARIDATLDRARGETSSPGRGSPQFIVRYPDEAMRAKIARLAKANNHSINAEIVDRLQKSMIDDAIHNLEESMGEIFDRLEKLERIVSDHADQLKQ